MAESLVKFDIRYGYLGWSNVRGGLEFYRDCSDGKNSRWEPRECKMFRDEKPTTGRLLQDDIYEQAQLGEGCGVVVITVGSRDHSIAARLCKEIQDRFADAGEGEG